MEHTDIRLSRMANEFFTLNEQKKEIEKAVKKLNDEIKAYMNEIGIDAYSTATATVTTTWKTREIADCELLKKDGLFDKYKKIIEYQELKAKRT